MSCRVLPLNLFAGGPTWPLHGHQKAEPRLALGRGCAQGCGNGLKCARHEWGGGRAWGRRAHTLDRGVTWGERKRLPGVAVLTGLTLDFTEAVFITGQSSAMFLFFSITKWFQSDGYPRNCGNKNPRVRVNGSITLNRNTSYSSMLANKIKKQNANAVFSYCWCDNAESSYLMSKGWVTQSFILSLLPIFLLTLTISIFLSLAVLFLVPLITRTRRVQAPVQDVTQQRLLLLGQLCCGCGHKTLSAGLQSIISSPWEKMSNHENRIACRWHKQAPSGNMDYAYLTCLLRSDRTGMSNIYFCTSLRVRIYSAANIYYHVSGPSHLTGLFIFYLYICLCTSFQCRPSKELTQLCLLTHPQWKKKKNADTQPADFVPQNTWVFSDQFSVNRLYWWYYTPFLSRNVQINLCLMRCQANFKHDQKGNRR